MALGTGHCTCWGAEWGAYKLKRSVYKPTESLDPELERGLMACICSYGACGTGREQGFGWRALLPFEGQGSEYFDCGQLET